MAMQLVALCSLAFVFMAGLDWFGVRIHIQRQYRSRPDLREYQRKNALFELLMGGCGIALLLTEDLTAMVVLGGAFLVLAVMMALNHRRFVQKG